MTFLWNAVNSLFRDNGTKTAIIIISDSDFSVFVYFVPISPKNTKKAGLICSFNSYQWSTDDTLTSNQLPSTVANR